MGKHTWAPNRLLSRPHIMMFINKYRLVCRTPDCLGIDGFIFAMFNLFHVRVLRLFFAQKEISFYDSHFDVLASKNLHFIEDKSSSNSQG